MAFLSGSAAGQTFGNSLSPNWHERAMLELINRARSAPATALAGCSQCLEAACYSPIAPLVWHYDLNQSARFHSASRLINGFYGYDTPCVLFADIDSRYPGSSNGSFATSCSGNGTTPWANRINAFATPPQSNVASAEIVGDYGISGGEPRPQLLFDQWMSAPMNSGSCATPSPRYQVLANTGPAVGVGAVQVPWDVAYGYDFAVTLDFGRNAIASVPKIPSASHWFTPVGSRDVTTWSTTAEFWVNWSDSAGPSLATAVIDGVVTPMTHPADRGSLTNGSWTVTATNVSPACHRYYFAFKDAAGTDVRYPATGVFTFGSRSCPDWQSDPDCTPPAITAQPPSVTITSGASTILTVTAPGDGVSYQWYEGTTGATGTPIGSNSSAITVSPTAQTNYWVRIVGNCGTVDSDTATVSMAPPAAPAALLYLVPQCRLVDTRNPDGPSGGPALHPDYLHVRVITVAGQCGIPNDAKSVSLNLTFVSSDLDSNLTLFPTEPGGPGSNRPAFMAPTMSCRHDKTCANSSVTDLSEGTISIYSSGGFVHFIIDVNGYFK